MHGVTREVLRVREVGEVTQHSGTLTHAVVTLPGLMRATASSIISFLD